MLAEGRREGGERGAESYDRKEAWSSKNYSVLSGFPFLFKVFNDDIYNYNTLLSGYLILHELKNPSSLRRGVDYFSVTDFINHAAKKIHEDQCCHRKLCICKEIIVLTICLLI